MQGTRRRPQGRPRLYLDRRDRGFPLLLGQAWTKDGSAGGALTSAAPGLAGAGQSRMAGEPQGPLLGPRLAGDRLHLGRDRRLAGLRRRLSRHRRRLLLLGARGEGEGPRAGRPEDRIGRRGADDRLHRRARRPRPRHQSGFRPHPAERRRSCSATSSTTPAARRSHDPARIAALHDAIAGIAVEDVYLRGGKDENNPLQARQGDDQGATRRLWQGGRARARRSTMCRTRGRSCASSTKAEKDGFIPYAAPDRDLDRIAIHGTPGADGLAGGAGRDRLYGRGGPDSLWRRRPRRTLADRRPGQRPFRLRHRARQGPGQGRRRHPRRLQAGHRHDRPRRHRLRRDRRQRSTQASSA